MAATTINMRLTFEVIYCCNCGIAFAMTDDFKSRRREDHQNFYCPSGHGQHFTDKSKEEVQRSRADWYARQLANRDEDLRIARVSLSATRGQLTKVKNRAEKGVCLHCKRSFVNVKRHVEHMHADVVTV